MISTATPTVSGWTVTYSNNEYTFAAQGATSLAPGQEVSFTRKVKINSCENLTESYEAVYGCGTVYQECTYQGQNNAKVNVQNSIDTTVRPKVVIHNNWSESEANGSRPANRYCLDTDYYRIFKIENEGQATALNYKFTIWTIGDNASFSTFFYDQYELSENENFSGATIQTDAQKEYHTQQNASLTGANGKVRSMVVTIPTIEPGKIYYLRFKLRNNNYLSTVACENKPNIFNLGYVQRVATYQSANTCGAAITYDGGNRTTQSAVNNYYGLTHESSFSAVHGQEIPVKLRSNIYHSPGNSKAGDYFEIVVETSPSLDITTGSMLLTKSNGGVFANTTMSGPETGTNGSKIWRYKIPYAGELDARGGVFQFKTTYTCSEEAWYKVHTEIKRSYGCEDSNPNLFKSPCTTVNLIPTGCSTTCEKGGIQLGEAKAMRLDLGYKSPTPDDSGKPVYPLQTVDPAVDDINGNIFHVLDRVEISHKGKVVYGSDSPTTEWKKGRFEFDMPDNLTEGSSTDISTIVLENSGKFELKRGGQTYVVENLPLTITGNKVSLDFDATTLGLNNGTITHFLADDELRASLVIKPRNMNVTVPTTRTFNPEFYFLHEQDGEKYQCGAKQKVNGVYVISRVTFNVYNYTSAGSKLIDCRVLNGKPGGTGDNAINSPGVAAHIILNGNGNMNAAFNNENRQFVQFKKLRVSVPEGLTMTGMRMAVSNQGTSSITHAQLPQSVVTLPTPVSGQDYDFDLQEILKEKFNVPSLNIDEGVSMYLVPEIRKNCNSQPEEEIKLNLIWSGTATETNFGNKAYYEVEDQITNKEVKIKYLLDVDKFTSNVVDADAVSNTEELKWVVRIQNVSQFHTFNKVWLGSQDLNITSVQEINGPTVGSATIGAELTKVNGVYQIGDIGTNVNKYYLVKATNTQCEDGNANIIVGNTCEEYPTAVSETACKAVKIPVTFTKTTAGLQTSFVMQPDAANRAKLCDQLTFEVEINNSGQGLAKDIKVRIPLGNAEGLDFVAGSAYHSAVFSTGVQTSDQQISDANVAVTASDILITLPATVQLNSAQKVRVKVSLSLKDDCSFRSGQRIGFYPKGKNYCGSDIVAITGAISNRVVIEGAPSDEPILQVNQEVAKVLYAETVGGQVKGKYTFQFTNTVQNAVYYPLTSAYRIAIKLPTGWSFDTPQTVFTGANADKVQYESHDQGSNTYVYKFIGDLIQGQSLLIQEAGLTYDHVNNQIECVDLKGLGYSVYSEFQIPSSSCTSTVNCTIKHLVLQEDTPFVLTFPEMNLQATKEYCSTDHPKVSDLTALLNTNRIVKWYTSPTGGTALDENTPLQAIKYYAAWKDALLGCESERKAITISLKTTAQPVAQTTQTFNCSATVAQLQATGTAIKWYNAQGQEVTGTTPLVSGTYYATQTIDGCESEKKAITVNIVRPVAPVADATQTFCSGATVADLTATANQVGATLNWYANTTDTTPLVATTALTNGTVYYVAETFNGCESQRAQVTADVKTVVANAGVDQASTVTSFTMAANQPAAGENGQWSVVSVTDVNGGTLATTEVQIADATLYNTQVTIPVGATAELKWTVTNAMPCTAFDTVEIKSTGSINAEDDIVQNPVNGANGATGVVNVLTNDTKNGTPITNPSEVTLTVVTEATPINGGSVPSLNPTTGEVSVPAGTPAGNYTITYKICVPSTSICDTATVTVPVRAAEINAVNDDYTSTPVNGANGATLGNVLTNDTLNGATATIDKVAITVVTGATPATSGASVPELNPSTGEVSVPAGTPAGTYTIDYKICEQLNPSNCDTATVTVLVNTIDAQDDVVPTPVNGADGATNVVNVLTNDTKDGGSITDPSEVTLTVVTEATPINGGSVPTLDPSTGEVSVPAGTPAGNYTITYKICVPSTSICDTATVTVPVKAAEINAVNDDYTSTPVNGANGATLGNVLTNDTLNGATATIDKVAITVVTGATPATSGASVPELNPSTGEVSVPAGTPAGTYTIDYKICEQLNPSNCDTATVTVLVNTIDAQDDVVPTPVNGADGATNVVNVLTNDTKDGGSIADPSEVTLTVVTEATPINGGPVPTLNPSTGEVSVPAGTPAGNYTITYKICVPSTSICDTATVTVPVRAAEINAVNDDYTSTPVNGVNGATLGNVLTNDTLNGATATIDKVAITVVTGATPATSGASVPELNPSTGEVSVPAGTPAGTYTIDYKICEQLNPSNCDTATVTVLVNTIDAQDDVVPTPVNGADGATNVVNVLTNDTKDGGSITDPSEVTLTVVTEATPINGGSVPTLDPSTGEVSVPAGTPAGNYTITYKICVPSTSICDTATVTVPVKAAEINAVNDDYTSTPVNGANGATLGNVLTNDTLNGATATIDKVAITVVTGATPATSGASVPELNPSTGEVSVPAGTPAGTYTIDYKICEQLNPSNCDTATVTVLVNTIDAQDDVVPTPVHSGNGATNVINVLTNDTKNGGSITNPSEVTLTVVTEATPINGGSVPTLDPSTGEVSVPAGTPAGNYTITYKICVPSTSICDTATVTVPVAPNTVDAKNDINNTFVNTAVSGNVSTNDEDPQGDELSSFELLTSSTQGGHNLVFDVDGTYTFTPANNFTGTVVYEYKVCDNATVPACDTATLTIEVLPLPVAGVNTVVANDDTAVTTKDVAVTVNVKANDFDQEGNTFTVTEVTTQPTNGTVVVNQNGTITYTPSAGFVGTDSFVYEICDNGTPQACDTATVTVEVKDVPAGVNVTIANDDVFNGPQNNVITGNVLTNDTDPEGHAQTVTGNTQPSNGVVVMNPDGTFTYTPNNGFVGPDQFTYVKCDNGTPQACDTATVYIVVSPNTVDAKNDINNTFVNTAVSGNVSTNDEDPQGDELSSFELLTSPTQGGHNLVFNVDGTYTFTPANNFTGTVVYEYKVCDDVTPVPACDTATLTIEVLPLPVAGVNTVVANDDTAVTTKDVAVTVNVKANDFDQEGNTFTVTEVTTQPTNGTVVVNQNGTITYTPSAGFVGTDSFVYKICDNGTPQACDTATVTVEVKDVPAGVNVTIANDDVFNGPQNNVITGNVLTNDTDPEGHAQTVTGNTQPSNGVVVMNPDGTFTYTPNNGFVGPDQFTYVKCDNGTPQACDTATVYIVVSPNTVDAKNDINNTFVNTAVSGNVSTNDEDPQGDELSSFELLTSPTQGGHNLVFNVDGTYTFTPANNFTGTVVYEYKVCDDVTPVPACDTATLTIEVLPLPVAGVNTVVANDDTAVTTKDVAVTVNVKANDFDQEGNTFTVTEVTTQPTNGTVVVNQNGTITYTPSAGFVGTDSFVYEICDNGTPQACDTATVTVEVKDVPAGVNVTIANDDAYNGPQNNVITGNVLANDTDPEGHAQTVTGNTQPSNGVVVMNPDGTFTYTPNNGFAGPDQFEYTICDNGTPQACDTATVYITVSPFTIEAKDDWYISFDGRIGGVTEINVVNNNDLLNGEAIEFGAAGQPMVVLTPGESPVPGKITMDPDTGIITIDPTVAAGVYAYPYTICTNTAPVSNCSSAVAYVVVDLAPADVTIECGEDYPTDAAEFGDADNAPCRIDVSTITYEDVVVEDKENCTGKSIYRTWTVVDSCGNERQVTQEITVVDTVAPTFVEALPQDVTVECDAVPSVPVLTVEDCSDVEVVFEEVRKDGNCASNYTLRRTWTATDACGNQAVHTQVVIVQDTTAPEFVSTLPAKEIFIRCEDLKEAEKLEAKDNCGDVTYSINDEVVPGECVTKYAILRTWTATDECGNSMSYTQTINLSCPVEITNVVTPNGDKLNDYLVLDGIECYPGNRVEIYNRWGVLVYETDNYNSKGNVFEGYSNGRVTISQGSMLPTGTYYYVVKYALDLGNGEVYNIDQAGFIHLETK
ncbi:Ig-like domain-containing protein [Capnocytophaga sp. ARDL2]|uniref:Ig-like domain-containing protein n=1 Tax=Capnocytophaga sp. ARDL2 TaxID=3238809 RepID=UPI003557CFEC